MAFSIIISIDGKGTNSPQNKLPLFAPLCISTVERGDIRLLLSLYKPVVKGYVSSYIAQYRPVLMTSQKCFTLYFPGRLVQSNTVSISLLEHMSTTVYSQVLIYTAE